MIIFIGKFAFTDLYPELVDDQSIFYQIAKAMDPCRCRPALFKGPMWFAPVLYSGTKRVHQLTRELVLTIMASDGAYNILW